MLTQRQRKTLAQLHSRHGRQKITVFLVEGITCCAEALRQKPDWLEYGVISDSFAETRQAHETLPDLTANLHEGRVIRVPDRDFDALAATASPQGILCVMRRPDTVFPEHLTDPFSLILDRVCDPGNVGTILRTAWAVGLGSVWLTKGCADPFSPKAIRSGMGAQFGIRIVSAPDLRETGRMLSDRGHSPLYLALPSGGVSCFDDAFRLPGAALAVGNEAQGILEQTLGPHVSIPMPGRAESLNVSQAATVLLLEAVRRGLLV